MDLDQIRTFLAVVETGNFVGAGSRVFVTQSTVSKRIASLEDELGKPLFERNKAGSTLTPAGAQFQRHAVAMVRVWEQARLEIALPEGYQAALTVGGQYSLWDGFLIDWLSMFRSKSPDIAIRTQLGFSAALMQRLIDGTLDIGVMYTPTARPGFEIEMLFQEELVLVTSGLAQSTRPGPNYVYVDWGPEFQADHSLNFPELSTPGIYMELGSLGLKYVLENEASGYFPNRLIEPHLASGSLKLVPGAPKFDYPAYVVFPTEGDTKFLRPALDCLHDIAATGT